MLARSEQVHRHASFAVRQIPDVQIVHILHVSDLFERQSDQVGIDFLGCRLHQHLDTIGKGDPGRVED